MKNPLSYFKPSTKNSNAAVHEMSPEQLERFNFINTRYRNLDTVTNTRYSEYRLYDAFIEGNQWIRIPKDAEDGSERLTHNLCEPTVRKYASFLMANVPKVYVPRESELSPYTEAGVLSDPPITEEQDETIPVEFERAEAIDKVLEKICFIDNDGETLLRTGAYNGSGYGDTFFYSYWNSKEKKVCWEELFPGRVRMAYKNNSTRKVDYAFIEVVMPITEIQRIWGVVCSPEQPNLNVWDTQEFTNRPSALVKFYWDEDSYCILTGTAILQDEKNNTPSRTVPIFHIPNLENGKNPMGRSDLKNLIQLQESYNMALSDEANLSKMYASPKVLVKDPGNTDLKALAKKGSRVIPIGAKTSVDPLTFRGEIYPLQNRINRVKGDYHDISGLGEAAFGRAQGSIVTGVAMTAQFQPTLQIVMDKIGLWNSVLTRMFGYMLELMETYGGDYEWKDSDGKTHKIPYKTLINGWRTVRLQWGNKVPRDDSIYIQNQLLLLKAGVQSRSRTMQNLGIDNPQDELQEIAYEQNNPSLNPTLAIQKELAEAQTGSGNEDQVIAQATAENQAMAQGEEVPAVARNAKDHKIHLAVHEQFLKDSADLPPEVVDLLDAHIQGHELALQQGGSQGGMRVNAGRPTEETESPTPAAADQAMAEAQAASGSSMSNNPEGY